MKRALPIALLFALVLSVPAIPQADDANFELARKVDVLEKKLAIQEAMLKTVEAHMATQDARGAELARALNVSEKKGFLDAGANVDAKEALFKGLRALVGAKKKPASAQK